MASAQQLYEALRSANMEQYFDIFTSRGINHLETLSQLTMQEYASYGVTNIEDRKRLFQLIQLLKKPADSMENITSDFTPSSLLKTVSNHNLEDNKAAPPIQANSTNVISSDLKSNALSRSALSINNQYSGSPKRLNAYGVPIGQTTAASRKSNESLVNNADRIRVCVRKRPLSRKELAKNEQDITIVKGRKSLIVNEPKAKVDLTKYIEQHEFVFDEVFDADSSNEEVYKRTCLPLVESIFQNGKATCFAYGQTGSGKTYTMLNEKNGLYVLAARDIFALLERNENHHLNAWVSFYEIYQGQLYDLLNNRKKLFAREDGKQQVQITGLQEHEVNSVDHLLKIFQTGSGSRTTGTTGANSDSSRSHAILQIVIKVKKNLKVSVGKFSFIDLAGSERGADRGETDQKTRMEGSEINKSLLALKECIRALDQVSKHTPFRQSKLTQVLKDSFIGNSRTCMIATISPNVSNSEHSLNTLRYADRVKELKSSGPNDYDDYEMQEASFDEMKNEDDNMIEDEYPPDALGLSDVDVSHEYEPEEVQTWSGNVPAVTQKKQNILNNLNSKAQNSNLMGISATIPSPIPSSPALQKRAILSSKALKRMEEDSDSVPPLGEMQLQLLDNERNEVGNVLYRFGQLVQNCQNVEAMQALKDNLIDLYDDFVNSAISQEAQKPAAKRFK